MNEMCSTAEQVVVLTTEWLPKLQTNWRNSIVMASCFVIEDYLHKAT